MEKSVKKGLEKKPIKQSLEKKSSKTLEKKSTKVPDKKTLVKKTLDKKTLDKKPLENASKKVLEKKSQIMLVDFYEKAKIYWSKQPPTVDGVMGGMAELSPIDIQGSKNFLKDLRDLGTKNALDCGAGIGRVAKGVLMPKFERVDLVEQNPAFVEKAYEYCTTNFSDGNDCAKNLGEIYLASLQDFKPKTNTKYDIIWCQWVLGHLRNDDLCTFFKLCKSLLTKTGYFVIKENVNDTDEVEEDDEDSSIIRPLENYVTFLKQEGFEILKKKEQLAMPDDIFPIWMIASRPKNI